VGNGPWYGRCGQWTREHRRYALPHRFHVESIHVIIHFDVADQGTLTLNDPVHKLVPDVWFENRWEATDPIRIVNVLEHITGWDDLHLREYAKQAPDNMGVREGLDYDHHSRTSRWRPGTRMSYCNSGPPVAAYIVEKLTGQKSKTPYSRIFSPLARRLWRRLRRPRRAEQCELDRHTSLLVRQGVEDSAR
jgi:hypothetical protein